MAIVDEIKSRLDILDVVSPHAQLQHSGRSYKAICPFHTERTASFFVFPERQSWRCFGACATGGDVFSFLMRIENLDFGEALKRLAQQAGVNLEETRGRKGQHEVIYQINEAAREFFCNLLTLGSAGSAARAYIQKRGLTQETIQNFQLGLSPADGKSLMDHLASRGYVQEQLALAGVVTRGQGGEYRDLFRRRLMFPIRDAEGRLAGFGGRSLNNSDPKYLNSPRSPAFDKGRILYLLHLTRAAMREGGAVIVEGYMDAIMAHQYGFSNVVASLGTALTQEQVSLVSRLVRQQGSLESGDVILALDPDVAGQEATLRSLESSWNVFQSRPSAHTSGPSLYGRQEGISLKVAALPQGKDPDEIIRESPEEWANLVTNAVPFIDYLFTALSSRLDLGSPHGKSRLSELMFPLIAVTPDPFQQDHYFQRLATLLGVSEATLQASLGHPRTKRTPYRDRSAGSRRSQASKSGGPAGQRQEATMTPFTRLDHDPLEEYCLSLILQNPHLMPPPVPLHSGDGSSREPGPGGLTTQEIGASDLRLQYFQRVENREVFTNWMKCSTLDGLREALDEELKGHLEYLLIKELPPANPKQREAGLRYGVRRLEERYLRELNIEEGLMLSQATPEERDKQERTIVHVTERLKRVLKE